MSILESTRLRMFLIAVTVLVVLTAFRGYHGEMPLPQSIAKARSAITDEIEDLLRQF